MPDPKDEITQPKKADIVVAKDESQFKDFQAYAESLSTAQVVKPNCKLCTSQHRKEAEEMFARDTSMLKIHRWLTEKGEQISYPAVTNHLEKHYKEPFLAEKIKDYAEDLHSWTKIQQEKEDRIGEHIVILTRLMKQIDANTDKFNMPEQRKSAETISKLVDQIGKEEERLEKLKRDASPITILLFRFEEMIKIKVSGVTSPELKVVLLEILEEFSKVVQEIENGD